MRYERLPKKTPRWLVAAILVVGGCLGYSIIVTSFIALYGLFGLFGNFLFDTSLNVEANEALFLGILGAISTAAAVGLSILAMKMNELSRHARTVSRVIWLPLVATFVFAWRHNAYDAFSHHIGLGWVIAIGVAVVLGGLVPALLFSTKAARKLHSR